MRISPASGPFNSRSSKVRGALASLKRAALKVLGKEGDMVVDRMIW